MEIPKKLIEDMYKAFDDIQQPRTPYVLQNMVVWARFTDEQAYAQCVLEMSIAHDNLRLAKIDMEMKLLEIKELKKNKDRKSKLEIMKKEVELEQTERAVLWAQREFHYLFNLWKKRPKKYTREDLNKAQPLEYKIRLETQAKQDLIATWRISQSNCEWLRQIWVDPIKLSMEMLPAIEQQKNIPVLRDDVETKYLEEGKLRALIIIPSEHRMTATKIDELIGHLVLPTNVEVRIENISESPVADNYNTWFEKAIKEWCTHVVTIEDDQVLKPDSLIKLFDFALDNPNSCVWAWYPKRQKVRQGVHIVLSKWWHREFLKDDGKIHECKTLAMGLSIYPTRILAEIDFPRCKTTNSLSQDSYLSQKIRDKGYKLLCDTKIKIGHKDKDGTIYK